MFKSIGKWIRKKVLGRSYRVGNVLLKDKGPSGFHIQRMKLKKHGTVLGFDTPDVKLALVKKSSGKYEGAMRTKPRDAQTKMHAIAHALHLKLYAENGMRVNRSSPIFMLEHMVMEGLQHRKVFDKIKSHGRVTFDDAKQSLNEEHAPEMFAIALIHSAPSRKKLADAIGRAYADHEFKQRIMELNASGRDLNKHDLLAFIHFFEKELRKK